MSPVWSVIFFACSIFNFYVYGLTHDGMQAGLGVLMGVLGLAYMFGSVLVIEDSKADQAVYRRVANRRVARRLRRRPVHT